MVIYCFNGQEQESNFPYIIKLRFSWQRKKWANVVMQTNSRTFTIIKLFQDLFDLSAAFIFSDHSNSPVLYSLIPDTLSFQFPGSVYTHTHTHTHTHICKFVLDSYFLPKSSMFSLSKLSLSLSSHFSCVVTMV